VSAGAGDLRTGVPYPGRPLATALSDQHDLPYRRKISVTGHSPWRTPPGAGLGSLALTSILSDAERSERCRGGAGNSSSTEKR
jgi:hypothetical protein